MARKKFAAIYFIVNLLKGEIYIGSSVDVIKRLNNHIDQLLSNKHPNQHMQNSFNKYGRKNFDIMIIEYIEDKNKLLEREQYWIDSFVKDERHRMYNICLHVGNSLGYKHTEESKKKMSKYHTGKKLSPEHKKAISEANKGEKNSMFGKHRTEEEKRKISGNRIYKKGKDDPRYGKPLKKETIEKRSKTTINNGSLRGENNGSSKLTEIQVLEIKKLLNEGNYTQKEIAKMFNMGETAISYIKKGKSWSHVKLPI